MAIRVHQRLGRLGEFVSIRVQVGREAVPFNVAKIWPLLYPTQRISELPRATAMALIRPWLFNSSSNGNLIVDQPGTGVFTFVLRHKLLPPASIESGLFGSRIKGAMKLTFDSSPESAIPPLIGYVVPLR